MAGHGDRYIVQHIPLIVLDPSSDSSDDDTVENVPQTPPPAPVSPIPAPPASPPPPIPPPPQSPPPSDHSGSSGHTRTPVRFPTVSDDSDSSDHPVVPAPRGRPRTRAAARKSTGYRPTGPLAPRDMFPNSTFEMGGSSRQPPPATPQPDCGRMFRILSADIEEIRGTARDAAWEGRGAQMAVTDVGEQVENIKKAGQEWKEAVEGQMQEWKGTIEDQIQGIVGTVAQYHLEMIVQTDRFQQILTAVEVVGIMIVMVSLLPWFWT